MNLTKHNSRERLAILDGWRALSILAVLAGHWVPLGPASWQMNAAVAASGMALFFCLSGFLITHLLLKDDRLWPFLLKRVSRIIPLAWGAMIVLIIVNGPSWQEAVANLLFFSNLPRDYLLSGGHHLWSLCVEMQFYIFVAILVRILGQRALYLLPLLCVGITVLRMANGEIISIVTWHRVDEILAGAALALFWQRYQRNKAHWLTGWAAWLPVVALSLLLIAANPHSGALGYMRPYFAAFAIGSSLFAFPVIFHRLFASAPARYVAGISYALYVVHGMLGDTWLGGKNADTFTRYMLRIPLSISTLVLAHLSTHYYEKFFTRAARSYLSRRDARTVIR